MMPHEPGALPGVYTAFSEYCYALRLNSRGRSKHFAATRNMLTRGSEMQAARAHRWNGAQ